MQTKLGVDIGGSFIKSAYFDDKKELQLLELFNSNEEGLYEFIEKIKSIIDVKNSQINITGGGAYKYEKLLEKNKIKYTTFQEFQCIKNGIQNHVEKLEYPLFISTNGTGTSFQIIDSKDQIEFQYLGGTNESFGFLRGMNKIYQDQGIQENQNLHHLTDTLGQVISLHLINNNVNNLGFCGGFNNSKEVYQLLQEQIQKHTDLITKNLNLPEKKIEFIRDLINFYLFKQRLPIFQNLKQYIHQTQSVSLYMIS